MKKLVLFVFLLSVVLCFNSVFIYADTGPKPTLDIELKNIKTDVYFLDLLSKEVKYNDFNEAGKYPESYKEMPIYKYNEDGWMATHIRRYLLWLTQDYRTETNGKTTMIHGFRYFGIPDEFKVIVQYETGELFVSKKSYSFTEFNQVTAIDFETDLTKVSVNENFKKGDINSDNKVDCVDLALIRLNILGMLDNYSGLYNSAAADINLDGAVDSIDMGLIRKYLLGITKEL